MASDVDVTVVGYALAAEAPAGGAISAVSWPAIFAGASVAASASLVLLALGSGLGFAAVSPWPGHGVSATTFKVTTAIWLIVMQWLSAALGGYIAGRLRTRWVGTHTHEVFFRDTAHGLVTWAVSTVVVAAVLAGSVSSLIGAGAHAVGGVAAAVRQVLPACGRQAPGGSRYGRNRLARKTDYRSSTATFKKCFSP